MTRRLFGDGASYQQANLGQYGLPFFIKSSESTNYKNPKFDSQVASIKGIKHAYHFARFGGNSSLAVKEANYALSIVKGKIPVGAIIACDYEASASSNVANNTNAVIAFMQTVKEAGYRPWWYSYKPYINANLNAAAINKVFPNSLWIAGYAVTGRIDTPNFNYFPSIDGVAAWQFTDNYKGLGFDGSIEVIDGAIDQSIVPNAKYKVGDTVMVRAGATKSRIGWDITGWRGIKKTVKAIHSGEISYSHYYYDLDNNWNDVLEQDLVPYQAQAFKVGDWVKLSDTAICETNKYDLKPRRNWIGKVASVLYINPYSNSCYEYHVVWQNGTNNVHIAQQDLLKASAPTPKPVPTTTTTTKPVVTTTTTVNPDDDKVEVNKADIQSIIYLLEKLIK